MKVKDKSTFIELLLISGPVVGSGHTERTLFTESSIICILNAYCHHKRPRCTCSLFVIQYQDAYLHLRKKDIPLDLFTYIFKNSEFVLTLMKKFH